MKYNSNMLQSQSKLTSQGQVSVPAAVRLALALSPGSTLLWTQEEGRVTVQRAARHSSVDVHTALFGNQGPKIERKTLAQLKQGIRQHIKSRHAGS